MKPCGEELTYGRDLIDLLNCFRSYIKNSDETIMNVLGYDYFRLVRADLDGRVSPLDSPFQVLLDGAISFDS